MTDVREEVVKLWLAKEAAEEAYAAHPEDVRLVWPNGGVKQVVVRCGKSGKALLISDKVLECPVTGQMFLRSALGLPPLPERKHDDEDLEDAA